MTADDVRRVAYQRPFKAFRVKLSTGETIEISRALRTTVAEDRVLFGVNEDPVSGIAQQLRIVPLARIAAVEVMSSV
jgi:hypothetical protein